MRTHASLGACVVAAVLASVVPLRGQALPASQAAAAGQRPAPGLEVTDDDVTIRAFLQKLESRDAAEETPPAPKAGQSDLPPASQLVAEIEQFLRQQRPE